MKQKTNDSLRDLLQEKDTKFFGNKLSKLISNISSYFLLETSNLNSPKQNSYGAVK